MNEYPTGIILPNTHGSRALGSVLGITLRELALAPDGITFNLARPQAGEFSKAQLFWLGNCPEGGEYSQEACAYWLLRHFSSLSHTNQSAIRVKPSEERGGYECIFWDEGKPVSLGRQYLFGASLVPRFIEDGKTLSHLVEAWQRKEYEVEYHKTLGELKGAYRTAMGGVGVLPLTLDNPEHLLELQARDAGWKFLRPLALTRGV